MYDDYDYGDYDYDEALQDIIIMMAMAMAIVNGKIASLPSIRYDGECDGYDYDESLQNNIVMMGLVMAIGCVSGLVTG